MTLSEQVILDTIWFGENIYEIGPYDLYTQYNGFCPADWID